MPVLFQLGWVSYSSSLYAETQNI